MSKLNATDFFDSPYLESADAIAKGRHRKLESLLSDSEARQDPNHRGRNGVTMLFWAVLHSDHTSVKILLEQGADPNLEVVDGEKAIHPVAAAAQAKKDEVLTFLLQAGGDPNGAYDGRFATFQALLCDENIRMRQLVRAGADINAFDEKYGVSLVHCCAMLNDFESALFLLKEGAKPDIPAKTKSSLSYEVQRAKGALNEEKEQWRMRVEEWLVNAGVQFPVPHPSGL